MKIVSLQSHPPFESKSWRSPRKGGSPEADDLLLTLRNKPMVKKNPKRHWGKALISFFVVLFAMPLGHALMVLMEHCLETSALHYAAFFMGLVGLVVVIGGVFIRGDLKQTLCGLFGGLLYWTGWVEFLFQYYANRWGTQPEIENGVVVTKPEYVILPATFGMFMLFVVIYLFSTRSGCCFFNWLQRRIFHSKREFLPPPARMRHPAVVTFLELNVMMWACYLVLMFCYDKAFLGDHHPVTFLVGICCLLSAIYMFWYKLLPMSSWGAGIRMAIATVIIFWTPVEILGRINFFKEIWIQPLQYVPQMVVILAAFLLLTGWIVYKQVKK